MRVAKSEVELLHISQHHCTQDGYYTCLNVVGKIESMSAFMQLSDTGYSALDGHKAYIGDSWIRDDGRREYYLICRNPVPLLSSTTGGAYGR